MENHFKIMDELCEWLVMPFCFTNVHCTFTVQLLVIYLNDVLIYSQAKEEHIIHFQQLMRVLREEKSCINLEKVYFLLICCFLSWR